MSRCKAGRPKARKTDSKGHDRSLHFEDLFLCDEGMGGMIEIDIFDVQVCQQRFSIPELELGIVPRLFAKKGSLDSSRKNA